MEPIRGLAKRPMRMLYLIDCSGSMSIDGKMDTLNQAMSKVESEIRSVADANPGVAVMVQTLRFSSGASWTTSEPIPVKNFNWQNLQADELDRSDPGWVNEMKAQLDQAGAHAGRLRIGLRWHDRNDLDLHVKCPGRRVIKYSKPKCTCCGGWLDVDMNVQGESTTPVEHVSFGYSDGGTESDLVQGEYTIWVHHYCSHVAGHPPSNYEIWVELDGNTWKTFEGSVARNKKIKIDSFRIDGNTQAASGTGGNTDLGKALSVLGDSLKSPPHPKRGIAPLVVLLSDGAPTDPWEAPLASLSDLPWGQRAQRFAIAIGQDADRTVLEKFTGDPERVLGANNPGRLATLIQWASTQVLQSSLTPKLSEGGQVVIPPPPPTGGADDEGSVW